MSIEVTRTRRYIELQFTGAELIEVWGSESEPYGDGTITLTVREALKLARELIDAAMEALEEKVETALTQE